MLVKSLAFDEAVAAMTMSKGSPYFEEYVFYMHMIAQCRLKWEPTLGAAAAVGFNKDHYVLYLNPTEVIGTDDKGNEVLGFTTRMPLQHRLGILKHEMLHVCLDHVHRFEDYIDVDKETDKEAFAVEFRKSNIAADCALDQEVTRDHLPSYAIYPDNFPNEEANKHWGESAEFYYDLLQNEDLEPPQGNGGGSGDEEGDGTGSNLADGVGDHSKWLETEGDPVLQKEITKKMVEKAGNETIKAAGRLPVNYSNMLDNLTIRREVDWKRVLRSIVGNKKANTRKTIMRRDRRLPFANWLKGKTKDRIFELGVISDVSGSVSDKALYQLWGEIVNICDTYQVPVTMVQVDTVPTEPKVLTRKVKMIERKAAGGTYLNGAIEKFKEKGIKVDALVVTTDNYLFNDDVDHFAALKIPVIWLVEPDGGPELPGQNSGSSRYIKLKK